MAPCVAENWLASTRGGGGVTDVYFLNPFWPAVMMGILSACAAPPPPPTERWWYLCLVYSSCIPQHMGEWGEDATPHHGLPLAISVT